jgi:hypothetical protein
VSLETGYVEPYKTGVRLSFAALFLPNGSVFCGLKGQRKSMNRLTRMRRRGG